MNNEDIDLEGDYLCEKLSGTLWMVTCIASIYGTELIYKEETFEEYKFRQKNKNCYIRAN